MSKHSSLAVILLALLVLFAACAPNAAVAPQQSNTGPAVATEVPALPPADPLPAPTQAAEQQPVPAQNDSAVFVLLDKEAGVLRSYNIDGSLRFQAPAPELLYAAPNYLTVLKDAVYYAASDGADKFIYRASAQGTNQLFSVGKLSAFAVSPDEKWIAWSVLNFENTPPSSQLWIKSLDRGGKEAQQIAGFSMNDTRAFSLVPLQWSEDGSRLYVERSMTGMGGYILYGGRFSLYSYDLASGQFTTHIAVEEDRGACLDTFRLDLGKVVFHCGKDSQQIAIRDLASSQEAIVPMLPEQGVAGSSAISPSGLWLAYAAARSNPEDEAGQVAVVPSDLSAQPQVIFKVAQQRYPEVRGWLDEDTLLVTITNFNLPRHTVMTIHRDGTGASELAAGEFLGWAK